MERCAHCDNPTGRAGRGDDSLYGSNGKGPYCEPCYELVCDTEVMNDRFLDAERQIATLRAENARLTADLSKLRDDLETLIQQRDEAQRRRGEIEAENEALRADVVWAATKDVVVNNERSLLFHGSLYADRKTTEINGGYPGGTDADILRAVREARER